ncbi:MAG: transglycosylase domain-containing protein [Actinomycetota bacterium]
MTHPISPPEIRRSAWRLWVGIAAAAILVAFATTILVAWRTGPDPTDLNARVDRALTTAGAPRAALSSISLTLRNAVIATEDERFYRHHGVDTLGVLRAVAYDVTHLSLAQGASTITEQLAKVLYLHGNDGSPWRKLLDAVTAFRIEQRFSKERILASYLNVAYFGHGATGIAVASERYFGVAPGKLDLAQASLLAGLIQSPSAYDPFEHPSAARARQIGVLRSMVRNGFITEAEGANVLAHPLRLRDGSSLPAATGVNLAPGSLLSGGTMAAAAGLIVLGIAGLLVLRRPAGARPWRWAAAISLVSGLVLAARGLRVA